MQKNGTWIRILIVVGIALLTFAAGYGMYIGRVNDNTSDIKDLKKEGCIPAREAKTDIAVMQTVLEHIKGSVDRIEKAVVNDP